MRNAWKKITFEITNRCRLRCRICGIWRERPKTDLSVSGIQKLLTGLDSPAAVSLTGGEPFLHPEFDVLYKGLYRLFLLKKIRRIDIATNATSPKLGDFLKHHPGALTVPLSFSVSLDGLRGVHDAQRGKAGSFDRALKNILLIKKYGLPLALKFVITPLNYGQIEKVRALAERLGAPLYLKFFEELGSYYHRQKCLSMRLDAAELKKTGKILGRLLAREAEKKDNSFAVFSLKALKNYADRGNLGFIRACVSPACSLFVTCQGDIYNCLNQAKIGTLASWPSIDLSLAKKITRAARFGKCPGCLSYHGFLKECNLFPLS
ncbi:MAG: radical SAM protein [Candidatus Omnitrophota bacterium]